jgi:hypothetical protein
VYGLESTSRYKNASNSYNRLYLHTYPSLIPIPEMTNIVYSNRGSRRVIVGRSRIDSSSELGTLGTGNALTTRDS